MNAPERQFASQQKPGLLAPPLTLAQLQQFDTIIDVRSPAEFAEDHLPGAINLPVLSNQERIEVGTLYKQSSAFEAKKVGAALVARNIAAHIDAAMRDKPRNWKPLIYCWRGGSRSGAMAHILRSIGWGALQLEGGYKAWRGQVIRELEQLPARFEYRVICGRTGSGKSRLLEAMAADGHQVLDLEKLAAHKGSVLGDLPDEPQPSQKMFESSIWLALSHFSSARPVYVEAESKRVGVLRVPESLMQHMRQSECHEVQTPPVLRVRLLREEYAHLIANPSRLFAKLDCLKELHSGERIAAWKALAVQHRWDEFVADMLEHHYDPAYEKSMFRNYVKAQSATPLRVNEIDHGDFAMLAATLPA
ncbi:MAG: tRNA 2-selenouridine(34) synthase MnmH [Betaproteobacteria bacterium]|nr:tRNA 2-selenouridine(34) synthase MnmH [Betaproteobacteria bacterium]